MKRSLAATICLAMMTGPVAANSAPGARTAPYCDALANAVTSQAAGSQAAFVRSYEHGANETSLPAGLASTAFVYDNALAAIALVACGNVGSATIIGNALSLAARNDRTFTDGRVRNAYRAGPVGKGLRHCRAGGTPSKIFGPKMRRRTAPLQATSPGRPWLC